MNDIKVFEELGLDRKEAAVYLALLKLGSATISALGVATDMPRTSLYSILPKLQSRGVVYHGKVKNHTEWKCLAPKELYRKYKENLKNLEAALPDLENIHEKRDLVSKISPITYYESLDGVKRVYEDILALPKE